MEKKFSLKQFIKGHKRFSIKILILSILIIGLITFIILKTNPYICEYWTQNFVKFHVLVFGSITKYIPFSFTELLFFTLFVTGTVFFVLMIRNLIQKKRRKAIHCILNIVIMIFSVLTYYQVTAEMAYNRLRVDTPLYEEKVTKDKFKEIINYFIDDIKVCCDQLSFTEDGDLIEPYDHNRLNDVIADEYASYPKGYIFDFTTRTKPMISSFVYREFHITGVTFLPLGEANINYLNVNAGKPFTYTHELAHTKGVMREGDADLVAAYITLNSADPYLRYSGYFYTFGSLLRLARYTGIDTDYEELYNKLDARFIANMKYNSDYWNAHRSGKDFANWMNDVYLRISGQADGTGSYGDTSTIIDPETGEVKVFSNYQKLYFLLFYN